MPKTELKTKKNDASVTEFINSIKDEKKREQSKRLLKIFEEATGKPPVMWGASIVGFDEYHYKYASGREADWMATGFSPRAQNLTVYIMPGFEEYDDLMSKIGPYKTGKSCLYIKDLDDMNEKVLKELISKSVDQIKAMN